VSRLTNLIARVKAKDLQLGSDLDREFKALSGRRAFGLNFERHQPEAVELPNRSVRRGEKVRILPPRGSSEKGDQRLWLVKSIRDGAAKLELIGSDEPQNLEAASEDLVVVAEFRDFIYPGLVSTGKVECGGGKPFHTVINAENYHALKALTYTHRGKIDLIYIDPPYNSGATDWKYNNKYVEEEDQYRHSKWLAFMERRLSVAQELLNPADSVLIVAIDENESARLELLLEQMFPSARMQMLTVVINPKGVPSNGFSRVDEYLHVVQFGSAKVAGAVKEGSAGKEVRWRGLTRTGANGIRSKSPGAYYPVYLNGEGEIAEIGEALSADQSAEDVTAPEGLTAVWPTPRPDGIDGRWSVVPATLRNLLSQGAVRVGRINHETGQFPISYLTSEQMKKIKTGELEVRGRTEKGTLKVHYREDKGRVSAPRTVWDKVSHSASEHGSVLLRDLVSGRKFPYPKSLYAVEDALRIFVADKPDAVVLDFFSGSGTTAHALMRINRQDDGERQCISVTNNEVAAEEQKALRQKGLRPGDPGWEQWGIADYITKPRIEAAITGQTPDGQPINGDYKFNDEFPIADGLAENAEFFTLTYETPVAVDHGRAFGKIAPLLWMRAGSRGARVETLPAGGWAVVDAYGLLTDLDTAEAFLKVVGKTRTLKLAYIVTNDDKRFQAVAQQLPEGVEPVRLYESYLTNFRFASGGVS
jgi:adenine-specific DNA-methyltransferase